MESEAATLLAVDVLQDHFGPVVAKVGKILFDRGSLSIQELLHFTNFGDPGEEPLAFQQLRNAMLVMIQHGLVSFQSHPQAAEGTASELLQVYTIHMEQVLSRLRFPHFMEHVSSTYGEMAEELLFATLKYGRVSRKVLLSEAMEQIKGASLVETQALLETLVKQRILRPVERCSTGSLADILAKMAAAAAPEPPPLALEDGAESKKRKLEELEEGAANGKEKVPEEAKSPQEQLQMQPESELPSEVAPVPSSSSSSGKEPVYRCDAANLHLCLCKNMLCRVVEGRVSTTAAQVLLGLLSSVLPDGSGPGIVASWMSFPQIEKLMMGLGNMGRDPETVRGRLRKTLDLLSAHKDSLLKKRVRSSAQQAQVPGQEQAEWMVEWQSVRRLLLSCVKSQLVRDQFGVLGLRIFNFLSEKDPPQRLEENQICNECMVPLAEGREILHAMVRQSLVQWQQIPRSSDGAIAHSLWLFYVDSRRVMSAMEQRALQAMLNLRVRFRTESAQLHPLESRANSLTQTERQVLTEGRRIEDILEKSFLVLDAVPMICRQFPARS